MIYTDRYVQSQTGVRMTRKARRELFKSLPKQQKLEYKLKQRKELIDGQIRT